MPLFKKKTKESDDERKRSKFIEPGKVWVSLGRTVNLGDFNSMKFDAGFTGCVGDTLTIMREGVTAIQENETVEEAFVRAFKAVRAELDRELNEYRIKDFADKAIEKAATPRPIPAPKPTPQSSKIAAPKPKVEEIKD